jgi:hypothetical protein
MFQLNLLIQELQQKLSIVNALNSNEHNFLFMNLKSILFNLTQKA